MAGAWVGACSTSSAEGEPPAPPPPEVAVVTVETKPVDLVDDLPGRVSASRVAEVRARVAGIVLERTFVEGTDVKKGDVLFRIDPEPLAAALASARAELARAEAQAVQAEARAARFARLVKTHAVSQQEYDDAVAAAAQGRAAIAAGKAAVTTARLNLEYATVRAPISGRIGRAEVTEGALVGQGQATLLATIQTLDPVYVDLAQPIGQVQALRTALNKGELVGVGENEARVTVLREDGSTYPHPGTLLFTDVTVDPATGSVSLRALVPNPEGALLPGEFVRARLVQAVVQEGLTVPQQAVTRTPEGAHVYVVKGDSTVAKRPVQVASAVGHRWLIASGLQPGEKVVVEGLQRVRPGAQVSPVPWK